MPSPQWAAKAWRYWWLTSLAKAAEDSFVADVPGLQPGQLGVGQAGLDSAILVSPRLIASPRIADSSNVLSLASAPSFKWVKWRLKPVQSSTSISSSVILMRGQSNRPVWSISACARSGTAASSGVIFGALLGEDGIGQLVVLGQAGDGGQLLVQQLQMLFQVLVAVRVDRQGQGLLALEPPRTSRPAAGSRRSRGTAASP